AQGNVEVGFGADAEVVFLRTHAAAHAHFADGNARFTPRAADGCRKRLRKHDALVAALAHPRASGRRIQSGDGEFARFQATAGENLASVAGIDLGQSLCRGDADLTMMEPLPHLLGFQQFTEYRSRFSVAKTSE